MIDWGFEVAVATLATDIAILVLLMRWKRHDIARDDRVTCPKCTGVGKLGTPTGTATCARCGGVGNVKRADL